MYFSFPLEPETKKLSNSLSDEGGIKKTLNQVFKKITPTEFQYRKKHNLCFKCGNKFILGHSCKNKKVYMLLVKEKVEIVKDEEEVIEYKGVRKENDVKIALHALTREMIASTIKQIGLNRK